MLCPRRASRSTTRGSLPVPDDLGKTSSEDTRWPRFARDRNNPLEEALVWVGRQAEPSSPGQATATGEFTPSKAAFRGEGGEDFEAYSALAVAGRRLAPCRRGHGAKRMAYRTARVARRRVPPVGPLPQFPAPRATPTAVRASGAWSSSPPRSVPSRVPPESSTRRPIARTPPRTQSPR